MGNILKNSPYFDMIRNTLETTSVLTILLSVIIAYHVLKYFWDRRWLYYYASKMQGPSPAWPIVGNAFYFLGGTEDILDTIIMLAKKYKSHMRVWLGQKLVFAITQPKDLEIVMSEAPEKSEHYEFTKAAAGNGLFSAPADISKKHRKVIVPTFNQSILNTFVSIFGEHAEILVQKLKTFAGKGSFDSFHLLSRYTLDILCGKILLKYLLDRYRLTICVRIFPETTLGQKVHAQDQNSSLPKWIGRILEILYIRMFQIWLHPDFIWNRTALKKELDDNLDKFRNFLGNIIETKKQNYRKLKALGKLEESYDSFKRRKAFLDYLIELSEEGENWTEEELVDETATITMTGSDTTGSMISFALIMLGMHQEIQDKVYEELHSIFGDSDRRVTVEDLPEMKYLERVIKETLRLFPVGPVIARKLHKDVKLESHTLPKGATCAFLIIHTHRDPEIWPQPLKFDPDRFLPEEVAKRHPYAFVPFSGGPRSCIGPRYAMMAMKAAISTIVRNYKISTEFKTIEDIKLKADIVIKCVDGCKIGIEHRHI